MKPDEGHKAADDAIERFQAYVRGVYEDAEETARKNLDGYLKGFEAEDRRKAAQVKAGSLSEDDHRAWRQRMVLTGREYGQALDQAAQAMTQANVTAMAALSGTLPEVYAENVNFAAYTIEGMTGASMPLVDPNALQGMLLQQGSMFVNPSVDLVKDLAWNRQAMASALTAGVLLGESIPKLSQRLRKVTGANMSTATRIARTAVTGAENAGRVESYRRAQEMGIQLQQQWMATLDGRTRHSHRLLDGEIQDVGKKFSNGLRYPGDPEGPGAEIYNCRCTLVATVRGIDIANDPSVGRWSKLPKGMTYEQWKRIKRGAGGSIEIGRSLGAAAFRDIVWLPDGSTTKISEGTRITGIVTIAGKGSRRKIDEIDGLVAKYGGKSGEWEKKRGSGYVDDLGMSRPCELHWYEEPSVGRVKMKVSKFFYR